MAGSELTWINELAVINIVSALSPQSGNQSEYQV